MMKEQEKKKPKYTKKNVVKLSIIKTLREENRSNVNDGKMTSI